MVMEALTPHFKKILLWKIFKKRRKKARWRDIFPVLLPGPNTQGQLHVIALLNDPWEEEIKSWVK